MPITKDIGRQYPLVAIVPFTYADLVAGANLAVDLPGDAEVTGGELVVDTAWNSTTNTASAGDSGSATRYSAAVDLKSAGRTALTLTGYKYSAADGIRLTYAETGGAPTQGAGRLLVQYVRHNGRANERSR